MKLWISVLLVGAFLAATATSSDVNEFGEPVVAGDAKPVQEEAAPEDVHEYVTPVLGDLPDDTTVYFLEHFDQRTKALKRWIKSTSKKAAESGADADIAQYDGEWQVEKAERHLFRNDLGLVLKSKAKHAAIAAPFAKPFVFDQRPLVVQYEVQLQDGQTCGGAYLKLLTAGSGELKQFNDRHPYTIMFGPDKCGNDIKLHFIFRHMNPLTSVAEEKHCRKSKDRLEEPFKDKQPHLYRLVVRPDNTYTISVDHRVVNEGSLLVDFTPAVNPEREIDDPQDSKPSDWDEREKIADPSAEKPHDWDESEPAQIVDASATKPDGWLDDEEELVADPAAVKPDDWDTDMDGEWEPPLITNEACTKAVGCGLWQAPQVANPAYKGKWHAPLIENPNYRGKWAPRKIPNPGWFEDQRPFRMQTIDGIGFELWSMSADILFDNIIVTDNEEVADQWAALGYDLKRDKINSEANSLWTRTMRYMNYRPGYWALYMLYCSIPIGVYVAYLLRRSKESDKEEREALTESFVTRVIKFANENPYMYAMFLVFVGLPLTFIMYYCCKSAPTEPYESNLTRNKKSDLNQDDDPTEEDAADEAAAAAAADAADAATNQAAGGKTPYGLRNRKSPSAAVETVEDDALASESESGASNEESHDGESADEPVPDLIAADEPATAKKSESVADNTRKRRQRKE